MQHNGILPTTSPLPNSVSKTEESDLMFLKLFGKLSKTVFRIILARMIEAPLKKLVHFVPTVFPAPDIIQLCNVCLQNLSNSSNLPSPTG
jgi:hypothetical protein